MKQCVHCASHGEYCEEPCFHFNKLFEEYLVIAYAKECLQVDLETRAAWRKRCQTLSANARYLTHYAKPLIQLDRIGQNLGPIPPQAWPLWVKDRAEVAVKRFTRSRSAPSP